MSFAIIFFKFKIAVFPNKRKAKCSDGKDL